MAQVKDVQGEIKRVTDITEKEYTVKQGKNAGNTFKSYSIGICMDDGNWYNIKDTNKERAQEILINQKTNENFKPGDTVKVDVRGEGEDQEVVFVRVEPMLAEGNQVPALSGTAEM